MKSVLKSIALGLATILVLPLLASHFLLGSLGNLDRSLETHSQILSVVPGLCGSYLRVAFYRLTLARCSASATIAFGVLLSKVEAEIHDHVYIGPGCMLGLVTLERDVLLGPAVQIPSGPLIHGIERLDIPIRGQTGQPCRVNDWSRLLDWRWQYRHGRRRGTDSSRRRFHCYPARCLRKSLPPETRLKCFGNELMALRR